MDYKKVDYKELIQKAKDRIESNNKQYTTYDKHCMKYHIIYEHCFQQALFKAIKKGDLDACFDNIVLEHASHCLALKFARISSNPEHEDSYIDVIGYCLLIKEYVKNMSFKLPYIMNVDNFEIINEVIGWLNNTILTE